MDIDYVMFVATQVIICKYGCYTTYGKANISSLDIFKFTFKISLCTTFMGVRLIRFRIFRDNFTIT